MPDFTIENEPWNVYRLSDGTEVRVRVIMVAASRKQMSNQKGPTLIPMPDGQFIFLPAGEDQPLGVVGIVALSIAGVAALLTIAILIHVIWFF